VSCCRHSPAVTEGFSHQSRAPCNHTWLSGLQLLWSLNETCKVLNYYQPLRQSSLKLLSVFCLLFVWPLRSPAIDTTSCVIILAMVIKFQTAFSWCCLSRLYDSAHLYCLVNKLEPLAYHGFYFCHLATQHSSKLLFTHLLWDPKMQFCVSDDSPILQKLKYSVFSDIPGAWTDNSGDQNQA